MYTQVEFIKTHPDAVIPQKATSGAAGLDLTSVGTYTLRPGETHLIDTGLKIALEWGYEGQVRSRSGLALKGITVANAPGTIDSDYRGSLGVILINLSQHVYTIHPGDRVAQLVVKPVVIQIATKCVEEFSNPLTDRGESGYGSTG